MSKLKVEPLPNRENFGLFQVWQFVYSGDVISSMPVPIYVDPYFMLVSEEDFASSVICHAMSDDSDMSNCLVKAKGCLFTIKVRYGFAHWRGKYLKKFTLDFVNELANCSEGLSFYDQAKHLKEYCYEQLFKDAVKLKRSCVKALLECGSPEKVNYSLVEDIATIRPIDLGQFFTADQLGALSAFLLEREQKWSLKETKIISYEKGRVSGTNTISFDEKVAYGKFLIRKFNKDQVSEEELRGHLLSLFGPHGSVCKLKDFPIILNFFPGERHLKYLYSVLLFGLSFSGDECWEGYDSSTAINLFVVEGINRVFGKSK